MPQKCDTGELLELFVPEAVCMVCVGWWIRFALIYLPCIILKHSRWQESS